MFDLTGNHAYLVDCMELMREVPDKYFDLAVVDPPYGDGATGSQNVHVEREREREPVKRGTGSADGSTSTRPPLRFRGGDRWNKYLPNQAGGVAREGQVPPRRAERTGGTWAEKYGKKIIAWDVAPEKEYFDELFRVSRNQIIWGGNYFGLPPTRCFLIWQKLSITEAFSMAMCEYAWTSFNENAKLFAHAPQGTKQEPRFHPTQKPVALYRWIFSHYVKAGDKILDTHLGSGSSRIAAYDAGLDFIGCEVDETYFRLEEKRFEEHTAQISLFH